MNADNTVAMAVSGIAEDLRQHAGPYHLVNQTRRAGKKRNKRVRRGAANLVWNAEHYPS